MNNFAAMALVLFVAFFVLLTIAVGGWDSRWSAWGYPEGGVPDMIAGMLFAALAAIGIAGVTTGVAYLLNNITIAWRTP